MNQWHPKHKSSHAALSKICVAFLNPYAGTAWVTYFTEVTSVFLFSWVREAHATLGRLSNAGIVKYNNNKYNVSSSSLHNKIKKELNLVIVPKNFTVRTMRNDSESLDHWTLESKTILNSFCNLKFRQRGDDEHIAFPLPFLLKTISASFLPPLHLLLRWDYPRSSIINIWRISKVQIFCSHIHLPLDGNISGYLWMESFLKELSK